MLHLHLLCADVETDRFRSGERPWWRRRAQILRCPRRGRALDEHPADRLDQSRVGHRADRSRLPSRRRRSPSRPALVDARARNASSPADSGDPPPQGSLGHVWMPLVVQGASERLERVVGCGHVSGLASAALIMAAERSWRCADECQSPLRARGSVSQTGFPIPILSIVRPCCSSTPSHSRRTDGGRLIVDQAAAATGSRWLSCFVSMAQTPRAVLLANAIATTRRGFFAILRASHDPSGAPLRAAHRTSVMAPMMRSLRMSR